MKFKVKYSLSFCWLIFLLTVSCGLNSTIPISDTITPTKVEITKPRDIPSSTSISINSPTQTPTFSVTDTPSTSNEPGFIGLFGEEQSSIFASSLVFSPDGLILVQADLSVKLWDVNSHTLIRELKYPNSENPKGTYYATKALFSHDGSLIAVSITDYLTHVGKPSGRLLVWDVATGELKQDWEQRYAVMSAHDGYSSELRIYNIPVNAMVFFPSSMNLVYANGNRIEVKNAYSGEDVSSWSLGEKMYATDISIREDGTFLYILMKWDKDLTFPALYRTKFVSQIWHPASKSLRYETKFEEVYPTHANMWLVGENLIYEDKIKPSINTFTFSLENKKELPYRIGQKYFNTDASLMFVARDIVSHEDKVSIEIWDTSTWRNIHIFYPSFVDDWIYINDVAFSPDDSLLAMDYHGQVSLWDIHLINQP